MFDLVIRTSSAVQLAVPFCQIKWFWIPAIILNKSYTQRKLRALWKMYVSICLLCWKPISIATVRIKNYSFFHFTFFVGFSYFGSLIILWIKSINLNSNKNLIQWYIFKIIPLRQAVHPYVHTPIESSFGGHFQGFLKVLGEEELQTHQIKSVFQHQPTLPLLQIFQTPEKPIFAISHVLL